MIKKTVIDVVGILGLGLLSYGCFLYSKPLGFVTPGALMLLFAVYVGHKQ